MSTELINVERAGIELSKPQEKKLNTINRKMTQQSSIIAAEKKELEAMKREIEKIKLLSDYKLRKKNLRAMIKSRDALTEQFNGALEIVLSNFMDGETLSTKLKTLKD